VNEATGFGSRIRLGELLSSQALRPYTITRRIGKDVAAMAFP
jgi:hypothetical protein